MKRRAGCLLFLVTLGCVCTAAYAARNRVLPVFAHWLDVGTEPERVDAVLALAGDADTRPYVAAALVNAGLAEKTIVTDAVDSPDVQDGLWPAGDLLYRRVMVYRGVPAERILTIGSEVTSTGDEADALAAYLVDHPNIHVTIVTNAFHTRRARWVFARQLGEQMERVSFVSAPNTGFTSDKWWQTEDGFRCVTSEYVKLVYYWCRYGNGLLWIGGGVLGLIFLVGYRGGGAVGRWVGEAVGR